MSPPPSPQGTWRTTTKQWATPEGVTVPIQAAYDLVGNLFNVQSPGDLDGALSRRLGALIIPGQAGPMVDLDALLLTLVNEFNMGGWLRDGRGVDGLFQGQFSPPEGVFPEHWQAIYLTIYL